MDTFPIEREISISDEYGHVGRTYQPTYGFHTGLLCDFTFKKNIKIESGLQLYFKQLKNIADDDTIERNMVNDFNFRHSLPLDTIMSIHNYSFDIIIPLYFGYSYKRFSSLIGLKFTTFTFSKTHIISIHNFETNYYNSQHFNFEAAPTIKLEYLIFNKNIHISSYFEIDNTFGPYYDFQIGLKFKFYSLK